MKLQGIGRVLIVLAVIIGVTPSSGAEEESAGKTAFLKLKCNLCHGIESEGIEAKTKSEKMAGGDLSRVAGEVELDRLKAYLLRQEKRDEKEHKKEFKGTDEELQAILDWLAELAAAAEAVPEE